MESQPNFHRFLLSFHDVGLVFGQRNRSCSVFCRNTLNEFPVHRIHGNLFASFCTQNLNSIAEGKYAQRTFRLYCNPRTALFKNNIQYSIAADNGRCITAVGSNFCRYIVFVICHAMDFPTLVSLNLQIEIRFFGIYFHSNCAIRLPNIQINILLLADFTNNHKVSPVFCRFVFDNRAFGNVQRNRIVVEAVAKFWRIICIASNRR